MSAALRLVLTVLGLSASALAYPSYGRSPSFRLLSSAREAAEEYDYIIIGGGTAGLTVADRLTEDDNTTTVLVLEHGELSSSPHISTVEGGFGGFDEQFLYPIESVPQTRLHNRTTGVLAGRVVGGSSAVNAMMTVRGTAEDYDRWGGFFGKDNNHEWSWEGLLPYFQRALRFTTPQPEVASAHIQYDTRFWGAYSSSSSNGNSNSNSNSNSSNITTRNDGVVVGWPSFQYAATAMQFEAFRSMPGVHFPVDSGAGEAGVYWFPTFMDPRTVERSYARTAHHDVAARRPNYHLLTRAKVDHIVLEGGHSGTSHKSQEGYSSNSSYPTAVGVRFVANASLPTRSSLRRESTAGGGGGWNASRPATRLVRARREVILAAGGVHSPQVMQLSGLGPKQLLQTANISTVVDLPGVGQNFQDHPMLSAAFVLTNLTVHPNNADLFLNASFRSWADAAWKANRTGPHSLGVGNAAAWLPFPVISPRWSEMADRLAAQDHAATLPLQTDAGVAAGYAAQMQSYAAALRSNGTAFYNNVLTGGAGSGALVLLHPLSRGTIGIDPEDPHGREPLVDYRALVNPLDAALMSDMIRFSRRFYLANPAFADARPQEMAPGDYVESEEDLAAYLSETLSPTEYHPAGTCAMLPRELGGVVDQQLRVYGVQGLRIVDASIMPTLPGANTCQTVYAIAEKAADLIKAGRTR